MGTAHHQGVPSLAASPASSTEQVLCRWPDRANGFPWQLQLGRLCPWKAYLINVCEAVGVGLDSFLLQVADEGVAVAWRDEVEEAVHVEEDALQQSSTQSSAGARHGQKAVLLDPRESLPGVQHVHSERSLCSNKALDQACTPYLSDKDGSSHEWPRLGQLHKGE